jgi:hypothetical protein
MTLNSQSLNLNARQILFKRLSTAQAIAYTGPLGEVIIDANLKLLRVQDGVTAGGHLMITSNVTANLQAQIDNIKSNLDPAAIDSLTEIIANVNALLANNVESQLINSGFYANLSNTGNLTIDGSLLPKTHLLQDLGSKTRAWRSLYISNATAYFGNAALTVTNNGLQVFNANNQPLPIIANIKFPDGSIQSTAVDMAVLANIYSLLTPNISANLVGINNDVTNAISYFGNLANAAVTTVQANLQSQIDYIKTNIDPAALDSLTEIVTSFQGIDANVIANVSTLTTTVANLTANASSQQSNIDLLLSERSKLVSGSAELVLSAGGAQPYVSFPAATNGSQLQISESELASVAGNLALTSAEDAYIISNGSGAAPGGSKNWKFDRGGNLTLPNNAVIKDTATDSISFGRAAGDSGQGNLTVAIGNQAGEIGQGLQSTAVGSGAGNYNQGIGTVAIGSVAGSYNQGLRAVAVGVLAGAQNQGEYAVALGNFAGGTNQPNNSIVINASGVALNGSASGLFIDPIREVAGTKIVYYNPSTKEVTSGPIGLTSNSNVSITSNSNAWTFGTNGNLTLPGGIVSLNSDSTVIGGQGISGLGINVLLGDDETVVTHRFDRTGSFWTNDIFIKANNESTSNYLGGLGAGGGPVGVTLFAAPGKSIWVTPNDTTLFKFEANGNLVLPNNTKIAVSAPTGYRQTFTQDLYGNTNTGAVAGLTVIDLGSNAQLLALIDPTSGFGNSQYNLYNPITITYSDLTTQTFTTARCTSLFGGVIQFGYDDSTAGHSFPITLQTSDYSLGGTAIDVNNNAWKFSTDGNLVLPQTAMDVSPAPTSWPGITFSNGTFQKTAFTGSTDKVDILNTNGLSTTFYPTFVENRTSGQTIRADVDLTYRSDDNLLRSGNIQVGRNIYGSTIGGISDAIQLRPDIDIDKRFLFKVDSISGNYVRSSMEMPVAEVDKAVTLAFTHNNGNSGFIYIQGTDTNATDFNDAFNIMMNSGNVKISALSYAGGNKVWNFDTTGNLTLPQTDMNSSPAPVSLPGITWTDGTFQTGRTIKVPQNRSLRIETNVSPSGAGNIEISHNRLTTSGIGYSLAFGNTNYFAFDASQKRFSFSESNGHLAFGTETRNQTGHFNDIEIKSYGDGINGNVYITAGGSPTNTRWAFQQSGTIRFPDATTQETAYIATSEQKFDIKSTAFTAAPNTRYGVNTTSGAVIATLPASPGLGDAVFFADAGGAMSSNNLTIARNGNTIMGSAADIVVNTNGDSLGLFWNGTTWRLYE